MRRSLSNSNRQHKKDLTIENQTVEPGVAENKTAN